MGSVRVVRAQMMQHGEHTSVEEFVVESADTPKQHEALAGYYHGKSEHMRQMAAEHRSVGKAYSASKMVQRDPMQQHFSDLAANFDKASTLGVPVVPGVGTFNAPGLLLASLEAVAAHERKRRCDLLAPQPMPSAIRLETEGYARQTMVLGIETRLLAERGAVLTPNA